MCEGSSRVKLMINAAADKALPPFPAVVDDGVVMRYGRTTRRTGVISISEFARYAARLQRCNEGSGSRRTQRGSQTLRAKGCGVASAGRKRERALPVPGTSIDVTAAMGCCSSPWALNPALYKGGRPHCTAPLLPCVLHPPPTPQSQ